MYSQLATLSIFLSASLHSTILVLFNFSSNPIKKIFDYSRVSWLNMKNNFRVLGSMMIYLFIMIDNFIEIFIPLLITKTEIFIFIECFETFNLMTTYIYLHLVVKLLVQVHVHCLVPFLVKTGPGVDTIIKQTTPPPPNHPTTNFFKALGRGGW